MPRYVALLCAILPTAAQATTWYVAGTGRDSNPGTTIAKPFATLQHAANLTKPGDTVLALNGTYTIPCTQCDVLDITTSGTARAPIALPRLSRPKPRHRLQTRLDRHQH